jgi:hypothetical protein
MDVRADIEFNAISLFWSHVGWRAHDGTNHGHAVVTSGEARQTEIAKLGLAFGIKKNVPRLDVSMQEAGEMNRLEAVGAFGDQAQGLGWREWADNFQPTREIASGDELEDLEQNAVADVGVQDPDDMGVLEGRTGACLAHETFTEVLVHCQRWLHYLERNDVIEVDLIRAVDRSHTASTEYPVNAVGADLGTNN